MTERAIDRLKSKIKILLSHTNITPMDCEALAIAILQEENSHKAEAPASLVDELEKWRGKWPSIDPYSHNDHAKWWAEYHNIISRYRPVNDSALVGELEEYIYNNTYTDLRINKEVTYTDGLYKILRRHDKGVK